MKKKLTLLLLTSLLLTACAPVHLVREVSSRKTESGKMVKKSVKKKKHSDTTTTTEEEKEVVTEAYTYTYKSKSDMPDQRHTHTLTYQGDKFLTIKMEVIQPYDEQTTATLKNHSLEEVRALLKKQMDVNPDIQKLKTVRGVALDIDVTENYEAKVTFTFDIPNIDRDALSEVGSSFGDLSRMTRLTPKLYIAALKREGATKIIQQ